MPTPLDEYPIHQAPLPIAHMVSSDRNAYDRCYFNAHDRSGEIFLISGFGVYPNLGTMDAYASVRRGTQQVSVRMSDAISDDRLDQAVGPYRIEVIEPLNVIRLVCDADDHGIGFDLTWTGSFPASDEEPHRFRQAGKLILDAQRFAQVGTWSGTLRVDGDEIAVTPDRWVGTRDRSWGIRPVGEAEPAGRAAAEADPDFGFWWTYVPMRFDDFALILIAQEDAHGHRILNEATRVWPAESGRPHDQLGWPRFDIHYTPGTRIPTGATIHLTEHDGTPVVVEVTSLGYNPLNCGSGYGGDATWNHGMWKGRGWIDRLAVDLTDPAVAGMAPFGVIDHVGRAVIDGKEGWGLFEHSTVGRHDPSGFTDFTSVAP
jgi:hypothetical protein